MLSHCQSPRLSLQADSGKVNDTGVVEVNESLRLFAQVCTAFGCVLNARSPSGKMASSIFFDANGILSALHIPP
jgi:hypothetical protein